MSSVYFVPGQKGHRAWVDEINVDSTNPTVHTQESLETTIGDIVSNSYVSRKEMKEGIAYGYQSHIMNLPFCRVSCSISKTACCEQALARFLYRGLLSDLLILCSSVLFARTIILQSPLEQPWDASARIIFLSKV